jgi:hypothetical protein
MSAAWRLPLLSALVLLAACEAAPYHPGHAVSAAPPPPPPPNLTGAIGAPLAPAATMPLAGSSVPVVPGAPMRLSATEIADAFTNNTAQGVTANGLPYAAYFAADGQERFRAGSYNDVGTWRVLPDGRLCTELSQVGQGAEQCYIMYRSGNTISFQRPDGITVGSVNIVDGDPLSL